MIDLLMVTISFLLLTAVWSRLARIEGDAEVPCAPSATPAAVEQRLHVEMADPGKIVLHWNVGRTVIRTSDIAHRAVVTAEHGARVVRLPDLAKALEDEWRSAGVHRDATDTSFDELVLHTADDAPYAEIVAAMDAAHDVKRPCARGSCPAFRVIFADH